MFFVRWCWLLLSFVILACEPLAAQTAVPLIRTDSFDRESTSSVEFAPPLVNDLQTSIDLHQAVSAAAASLDCATGQVLSDSRLNSDEFDRNGKAGALLQGNGCFSPTLGPIVTGVSSFNDTSPQQRFHGFVVGGAGWPTNPPNAVLRGQIRFRIIDQLVGEIASGGSTLYYDGPEGNIVVTASHLNGIVIQGVIFDDLGFQFIWEVYPPGMGVDRVFNTQLAVPIGATLGVSYGESSSVVYAPNGSGQFTAEVFWDWDLTQ